MLALEVKVLAGMLIKLQSSALVAVLTVGRSVGRSVAAVLWQEGDTRGHLTKETLRALMKVYIPAVQV